MEDVMCIFGVSLGTNFSVCNCQALVRAMGSACFVVMVVMGVGEGRRDWPSKVVSPVTIGIALKSPYQYIS